MDRGLWITWYDLPEPDRAAYSAWLHATYLPELLRRPGYRWAAHYACVEKKAMRTMRQPGTHVHTADPAVPTGRQFILIVGAEDAHVFGDPVPGALHAALPAADRRMLSMRIGERVNIMTEAARVDGPARGDHADGEIPAPCVQLGSFRCDPGAEEEMLAWYAQWRMNAMRSTPGCVRMRRLASVAGWAKHAVLYEFESLLARNRDFMKHEDARPDMKAWSDRMVPKLTHAPGSASLACRIWPPAPPQPPEPSREP